MNWTTKSRYEAVLLVYFERKRMVGFAGSLQRAAGLIEAQIGHTVQC
ncbi:hypothetical protein [Rhizobium ruizarguesonis]|nr:hypothetical protein [Rhizobium ruizarguesonis]